jgi:large subunit ribosomal protein L3
VDGILGKKIGMTQVFNESGRVIPVTVIEAGPCPIVQIKTADKDGYQAVQLGFGSRKERKINRPELQHLNKANVSPVQYLREFRTDSLGDSSVGSSVDVGIFSTGDFVDIAGTSKGRGFAGVVRRWGFKGGRGSHGGEQDHRRPGSIGASAYPSRVFKGKKMAGRYGGKRITVQNLEVVEADVERNLLVIKGAIPGPNGGLLFIKKAVKTNK